VCVLAVIGFVARSYWPRRRAASASDTSGTEPTPSPGGSPGMGPAVAVITLMLFARFGERQGGNSTATRNPQPATIPLPSSPRPTPASSTNAWRELKRSSGLRCEKPDRPFNCFQRRPSRWKNSPRSRATVKLLRQGNSVNVRLEKKGEATLKSDVPRQTGWRVTKRHLAFGIRLRCPPGSLSLWRTGSCGRVSNSGFISQRRKLSTNAGRSVMGPPRQANASSCSGRRG